MLEIKSGTLKHGADPKPHYVRDVATQAWVLRQCGLDISRIELGQADGEFLLPADRNVEGILRRIDVTTQANEMADQIRQTVQAALLTVSQQVEPERQVGSHCSAPNHCNFIDYCSNAILGNDETFKVPVWHLASQPNTKIVSQLMKDGYRDLAFVPESKLERRMHRVMQEIAKGTLPLYVDPKLREHLINQPFPRYFLDYETNNPTLPLWPGTHPGEVVPFQFSIAKWASRDSALEIFDFLSESLEEDPRANLSIALANALDQPGPVYAWNGKSTEGPITFKLAERFPEQYAVLSRVAQSCRDMDPVPLFREWFYHPGMGGDWGLKSIVRAIFPQSPYEKLRIANGVEAMREYEKFLKMGYGVERDLIRDALIEYCNTDTRVMVDIWKFIEGSDLDFKIG